MITITNTNFHLSMRFPIITKFLFCSLLLVVPTPYAASQKPINVSIILDGPIEREIVSLKQIIKEVQDLTGNEFDIRFPEEKLIHGNWNVQDINQALETAMNDDDVDLVITNGLISSHQASQINSLKKPVIATIVADRVLQALPYEEGVSGKHNYVYISDNRTIGEDLQQFYQLRPFRHLAIIVDQLFLDALPELKGTTYSVQQALGFQITLIPAKDNPKDALDSLPADADAVYLPPLLRFSESYFRELADALIQRKLPSFSLLGRDELEMGALATLSGRDIDTLRYARRIALNIQSILLGTNAADLKVELDQPAKMAINMKTARAINFSPSWDAMEISDLLYEEALENKTTLGLVEAVQLAINQNLGLQVEKLDVELSRNTVSANRAQLLPQLNLGAGVTQIDRDRAGLMQSQRSSDSDITASQVIYSETIKSGYDVAKLLEQAANAELKADILDVISNSATAYLQTLLAHATVKVRRSNLDLSEANLELAESRLKIGYSDRSEVLRWQSQIATDRQNLYIAQSQRDQAETELKRQINMSLIEEISVNDTGIANLLAILDSDRFKRFFDNPLSFQIFTEFEIERAVDNAPELEQTDFVIESNQREVLAAERAYYVPDIQLNSQYGRNIERGGVGENGVNLFDDQWSVGVQATLPLFLGGARKAEVSRATNTLIQNRYQRANIKQQIEARVLTSIQQASGSYPAIRLANDAALAAAENLQLVTDSYSKGVLTITDVLNAQDASLSANLSAVEAQYSFMIDWVEIQRSVANFDLLLSPDGFESWYQALDEYYDARNR